MTRPTWSTFFITITAAALLTSVVRAGEGVRVEILEGPIPQRTWETGEAQVTATFTEAAFGFTTVPAKYSPQGYALDRSAPFLVRASQTVALPAGEYTLLLRNRNGARLYLDDNLVAELPFFTPGKDGHGAVPKLPTLEPGLRLPTPGQRDKRAVVTLDGKPHTFRLEFQVGQKEYRPELGDPVVAVAPKGKPFFLLADKLEVPYSEEGWEAYAAQSRERRRKGDAETRFAATADERAYWAKRHDLARQLWKDQPPVAVPAVKSAPVQNDIDRFLGARLEAAGVAAAPLASDEAFLRRVTLDTIGVVPTPEEIEAFRKDKSPERKAKVIARLLADPRRADNWMGYWQDVLAENPGLLKPTLNNTGPFRWWLHQALADNYPMDRFVTELTMMGGSVLQGAPAGFAIASENDVPMAAKAQVLARAFLAADLTCARCHDAPGRTFDQKQLLSLAALLEKKPITLPVTSTVKMPTDGSRAPAVRVSLKPGEKIVPDWQFAEIAPTDIPEGVLRDPDNSRERVAAILTSPKNERFAQVIANRVWKRLMGVGLVEPVDDWKRATPSHPELLAWLGRELLTHDYDLKHLTRLILSSHAYQRAVRPPVEAGEDKIPLFAGQTRRRLSAEQVVDSLFAAAGKDFGCEELTFDPENRMLARQCISLGVPRRAWQFTSLANERDRPALALPGAQPFVDALVAYGWRDSRTASLTVRDEEPSAMQSLVLANGLLNSRVARLSDDSAFTALALEDIELPELVRRIYLRTLGREPTAKEKALFVELLSEGYQDRRTGKPALPRPARRSMVAWSNHLDPEATTLKLKEEEYVRAGDPPTPRLKDDWRKRMEDMVWAILSSPEFVFVP